MQIYRTWNLMIVTSVCAHLLPYFTYCTTTLLLSDENCLRHLAAWPPGKKRRGRERRWDGEKRRRRDNLDQCGPHFITALPWLAPDTQAPHKRGLGCLSYGNTLPDRSHLWLFIFRASCHSDGVKLAVVIVWVVHSQCLLECLCDNR